MSRLKSKFISGVLSAAMVLGLTAVAPAYTVEAAEDMTGKLVVIHTNDMHGYYEKNLEDGRLGISSVMALDDYYENLGANVLLLDAGDFSQGTNLVNYFKGLDAVHFMNAAGYDAAALGNHEFDFGYANVKRLEEAAQFPFLAANVIERETGESCVEANAIFTFDNMKVGVFGLDTPETRTKASPKNIKEVKFLEDAELCETAQAQVNYLEAQNCDYIICIGHLGLDEESMGRRSIDVLAQVNGIDLFVDGHSHTALPNGMEFKGTTIVSTGEYLSNIGVVIVDGDKETAKLVTPETVVGECVPMDNFVASFDKIVDEVYAGKFATTLHLLNGERNPGVRTMETNLGDFSADAYKYTAETYVKENGLDMTIDGAIQNGGGIRATIEAGDISMDTLYKVFPYGNTISIVTVTGAELLEALEASCASCPEALGGFPQVSGIKFTLDTTVPYAQAAQYPDSTYYAPANPGSRVTIESVGGKAFKLNATYNIAVNNFMADGGDTYYVFTQASNVIDTGVVDAEGLISYVNSLGGVIGDEYATSKGNITIK